MMFNKSRDSKKQRKSLEANNYQKEVRSINMSPQRQHTTWRAVVHSSIFKTVKENVVSWQLFYLHCVSQLGTHDSPVSNVMV